jgi:hypothetical protein
MRAPFASGTPPIPPTQLAPAGSHFPGCLQSFSLARSPGAATACHRHVHKPRRVHVPACCHHRYLDVIKEAFRLEADPKLKGRIGTAIRVVTRTYTVVPVQLFMNCCSSSLLSASARRARFAGESRGVKSRLGVRAERCAALDPGCPMPWRVPLRRCSLEACSGAGLGLRLLGVLPESRASSSLKLPSSVIRACSEKSFDEAFLKMV